MIKVAFITGITGQDGSYLSELLLQKGYFVHGLLRPASTSNLSRIKHLNLVHVTDVDKDFSDKDKIYLHYGNLGDSSCLMKILQLIKPDEVYHLGAVSNVQTSFELPEYTGETTAMGTLRLLETLRQLGMTKTKFYQASSSEMFGRVKIYPQNENTPLMPVSPYGASKVFSYWMCDIYRRAYKMFACNGILFNHESPRRGENFVTRKITISIAKILAGKQKKLFLGNLDAKRDWGYAPEYVEAMYMMLQQDYSDDYVIATNETHSVKEFVETAFSLVNLKWQDYVEVDPHYVRPAEVDYLLGDYSKAKAKFGFEPKVKFKELVKILLEVDLKNEGIGEMIKFKI